MIHTFTANPAVDRTYRVDHLMLDEPLRPAERTDLPGGKGVNVARAVRLLGGQVTCHGPVAGHSGRWLVQALEEEELDHRLHVASGDSWATRTTTVVTDHQHAVLVYDRGDQVPTEALETVVDGCLAELAASQVLVVSGSLPVGDHLSALRTLLAGARDRDVRVVVDASGPSLQVALDVGVDVVKVDRSEAAEVTGAQQPNESVMALRRHCHRAVVTDGAAGAVASDGAGGLLTVATPTVEAAHPAGSGDVFTAVVADAMVRGHHWHRSLRRAAAAGAANTLEPGAGRFDLSQLERLVQRTPPPRPS